MFRVTFVLGTSGELRAHALKILLAALTRMGKEYILAHPKTPLLYQSGVTYEEEPGEQDQWQDIPITLALKHGDAEDLACWRAAELQARGVPAWPTFDFEHGCLHPKVRMPDGRLEDPARILGMKNHDKPCMGFASKDGETRVDFVCDTFKGSRVGSGGPGAEAAQELSNRTLQILLNALMLIDMDYLVANPQTPRLYDSGVRYELEPPGREEWQDIPTTLRRRTADCLPLDTLVLMRSGEARKLGSLKPGDEIASHRGAFTKVMAVVATGLKMIYRFGIGDSMHVNPAKRVLRCSPEHRVFLDNDHCVRAKDLLVDTRILGFEAPSRIRSVTIEDDKTECGDIETQAGRFYLPECDVVVHNCEDLATQRAAELRVFDAIKAYPTFNWRLRDSGAYLYHIQTGYPDGRVEDPSRRLGMK